MQIQLRALLFGLLLLLACPDAFSEPTPAPATPGDSEPVAPLLKPKRKPRQKSARNLASVDESESSLVTETTTSRETIQIAVALTGGLVFLNTSDDARAQARSTQGLNQNVSLGLQADFSAVRYFAADFDFFYGIAPAQQVNFQGTTQTTQSKSIQASGLLVHGKAQYPLSLAKIRLVPQLGAGFGWGSLVESSDAGTGTSSSTGVSTTALMAIFGLNAEPFRDFWFGFDYATSLAGTASFDSLGNTVAGSLSRIRLTGTYNVTPKVAVGAQYAHRSLDADSTTTLSTSSTTSPGISESQDQFLALARYAF